MGIFKNLLKIKDRRSRMKQQKNRKSKRPKAANISPPAAVKDEGLAACGGLISSSLVPCCTGAGCPRPPRAPHKQPVFSGKVVVFSAA